MAQEFYIIVYKDHNLRKEKRICAYNIMDARDQARGLQYTRPELLVLYVKSMYGRCLWL